MKKFFVAIAVAAGSSYLVAVMKRNLLVLCFFIFFYATNANANGEMDIPLSYQMGYSYSQNSWFNMSMNMKHSWGMFFAVGGFGLEHNVGYKSGINYNYKTVITSDKKSHNNYLSLIIGPTFRVRKDVPLYISIGVGYGANQEMWSESGYNDFQYLPTEFFYKTYEKNKKSGINYQLGAEYNIYFLQYLIGAEIYYNGYMGFGGGISFGFTLYQ
jgi:hypothetical protein